MYSSNKLIVTTDWVELTSPEDIVYWSIYPVDGDIELQCRGASGWGDTIFGFSGIPMDSELDVLSLRIKAVSGSVSVAYFLRP